MIELTPSKIAGLKLAHQGDLYPQSAKKWTHQNATVTYAKRTVGKNARRKSSS